MTQLSEMLDLAIGYDNQSGQLQGWLLSEDNPVQVDFKQASGQVGNNQIEVLPQQWRILDNTLYLGVDALELWFGIKTDIRTGRLMVNFTTEKQHPRHARLKRKKRYQQISLRRLVNANWPQVEDSWQALTIPNLDFNWQQTAQPGINESQSAFSLQGTGDLLWQSSAFSWFHSQQKDSGFFRLSRAIPFDWGDYYYQAGDVQALSHPFVSTFGGRGFNWLSSTKVDDELLTRRFEGDAPPGWDVELYRGDVVVAWQAVGDNGHFVFDDIAVSFGENQFSAKLYGPSGEQRQLNFAFAKYNLGVQTGQWLPELSLIQNGKSVLFNQNDKQDWQLFSRVSYGLGEQQALRLGYLKQRQSDNQALLNLELAGFSRHHRYRFNLGKSNEHSGLSYDIISTGQLTADYDYRLRWRDISAIEPTQGQSTTVGVSRYEGPFEHALTLAHNTTPRGETFDVAFAAGKRFALWGLSHDLSWQQTPDQTQGLGRLNLQWAENNTSVQLQASYQWQKGFSWQDWQLSWRHKGLGFDWQMQVNHNSKDSRHGWRLSAAKTFEHFGLGLTLSDHARQGQSIALNLTTALNFNQPVTTLSHQNQRNGATIEAWAFIDNDLDGRFGAGDQPLKGVKFVGQRRWQSMATDSRGRVRLPVSGITEQKVILNQDSLEDPFLHTPQNRFRISAHPGGKTRLDFPFYSTSELQSEVKIWDVEQQAFVLRGAVPLELHLLDDNNSKVVAETHSEYDGYFALDKLMPGHYRIGVKAEYLATRVLRLKAPLTFVIDKNNAGQFIELPPMLLLPSV